MSPPRGVSIVGLDGIPEVHPGDDLGAFIAEAADRSGTGLLDGDIVVVTHKVVSKAEGRLVDLSTIEPSPLAIHFAASAAKDPRQVEIALREARRIVRMSRGILITETKHGFVCANTGVDASNVPGEGIVCLLPEDPDGSAAVLRDRLRDLRGADVAVIITDSFGRPWRNGIVNVAVGVAGMDPFADYRGQSDPHGYPLVASRMAIADELSSAAELVMGKLDARPVALVRGYAAQPPVAGAERGGDLVMDAERDLFR
ncbi:MAG: coenzyme F420-0:L-glutamate ligase [Chloroflexota bacterium]|nr:MAG: coenzyme F420-0:L-glutamate ligase [Chloroflexota bacterium]